MTRRNKSGAVRRAAAVGAAISMMLALPCASGNGTGLPLLGIIAGAESAGTCGENLTWTLDDAGTLTISGTGDMYDEPETRWKALRNKITRIVIESGVTGIGVSAFADLLYVESVSLPGTLVSIGSEAFYNTGASNGIETIVIPGGVTSIGEGAFRSCGASRVTLPASITAIPENAFAYSGITEVDIPDKVKYIGSNAFAYCTSLVNAELPEGVVTISDGAFRSCSVLEYISLPATLTTIGERAFSGCDLLYALVLPGSLKTVGKYAFSGCGLLETVDIPTSVTSFGYGMFADDAELETIYYSGTESEWYARFKALDINTEAGVRSHLGIGSGVEVRFSVPQPFADFDSGLNTAKTALVPGEEFDLNFFIPPSANKADTISINANFDPDAFELVSWYSNEPSSTSYIKDIISGAWVNPPPYGNSITLAASNTTACIDLCRGILLTAKMRVKSGASAGDHKIYLTKSDVCRYDSGNYRYDHFWEPEVTELTLSVSVNPVYGKVTGYGNNEGRITLTLLDSAGNALDSMVSSDGSYMFCGLDSGKEYSVRASMPRCLPRTVTFTAEDDSVVNVDLVIRRYGDVNGDTLVDAKDATQILRYEAGLPSVLRGSDGIVDEYLLTVADITGRGKPSSKDATQILRYDAGLPSYFDRLV